MMHRLTAVKRYRSEKFFSAEEGWRHTKITLEPLNMEFQSIVIKPEKEEIVKVIAEYVCTLGK